MKKATAEIQIVTPCILAGTDQETAELRAASIRGQLRWWFRLLNPEQRDREKAIFGGVHGGAQTSSLVVRILTKADEVKTVDRQKAEDIVGSNYDYFLWPLGRKNSTPRGFIAPGEVFELLLTHRHVGGGEPLPSDVLEAFLLFGALGTRSRRGYGSIFPRRLTVDAEERRVPDSVDTVTREAERLLKHADCTVLQVDAPKERASKAVDTCAQFLRAFRCGSEKSGKPSVWGKNDHDAPFSQEYNVFRQVVGLPLEQRYSRPNRGTFRSEVPGADRWASPLLFKIVPVNGGYLPLAIFCNSMVLPEEQKIELKDRDRAVTKRLSHDMWRAMQDPEKHAQVGWNMAKRLV